MSHSRHIYTFSVTQLGTFLVSQHQQNQCTHSNSMMHAFFRMAAHIDRFSAMLWLAIRVIKSWLLSCNTSAHLNHSIHVLLCAIRIQIEKPYHTGTFLMLTHSHNYVKTLVLLCACSMRTCYVCVAFTYWIPFVYVHENRKTQSQANN